MPVKNSQRQTRNIDNGIITGLNSKEKQILESSLDFAKKSETTSEIKQLLVSIPYSALSYDSDNQVLTISDSYTESLNSIYATLNHKFTNKDGITKNVYPVNYLIDFALTSTDNVITCHNANNTITGQWVISNSETSTGIASLCLTENKIYVYNSDILDEIFTSIKFIYILAQYYEHV